VAMLGYTLPAKHNVLVTTFPNKSATAIVRLQKHHREKLLLV
jgi:hypothetical protein